MNGKLGEVSICPPSTGIVMPVIYEAAEVHRNKAQYAMSYAEPNLFIGKYDIMVYSVMPPESFFIP